MSDIFDTFDTIPMTPVQVEYHGPVAIHNMPCAVCRHNKAVLNMNTEIFHPCWRCQELGYKVRRSWWARILHSSGAMR